eukprot:sb/3468787/
MVSGSACLVLSASRLSSNTIQRSHHDCFYSVLYILIKQEFSQHNKNISVMGGSILSGKTQNAEKVNLYYLQQTCPILIRSTLTLTSNRDIIRFQYLMNAKYLLSFTAYKNAASIFPSSDGNVNEAVGTTDYCSRPVWRRHTPFDSQIKCGMAIQCAQIGSAAPDSYSLQREYRERTITVLHYQLEFYWYFSNFAVAVWRRRPDLSALDRHTTFDLRIKWGMAPPYRAAAVVCSTYCLQREYRDSTEAE